MTAATDNPGRLPALAVVASLALYGAVQLVAFRLAGVVEYPLDDPYIHLAMAEQIAAGGYGVNPGQYGSAASSPLYPLLLVPFAGEPAQRWMPMVWNVAGLVAAAWLWGRILWRAGFGAVPLGPVLAIGGPVALNFAGLAFTGMEHTLHLAASLAILLGLFRFYDKGRVGAVLVLGVTLAPLLRYEGLALALLAAGAVAVGGRLRAGAVLAALALVPLAGFTLFLVHLGLDPLPNSVNAKLHVPQDATGGPFGYFVNKFALNPEKAPVWLLLGLIALAVIMLTQRGVRESPRAGLLWVALGAGLAHLVAGRYGWMDRYEVYVVVTLTAALLVAAGPRGAPWLRGAAVLPVLAAGSLYLPHLVERTIWASRSVHLQHAQTARFVKDHWKAPVAVNDLGLVSWRNPHEVLDLWGLGNAEAQDMRFGSPAPGWADALMAARDVRLAVIYDDLFPVGKGAGWILLGRQTFSGPIAGVSSRTVSYYVTDPDSAERAMRALRIWAGDLPPGARFVPATNGAGAGA